MKAFDAVIEDCSQRCGQLPSGLQQRSSRQRGRQQRGRLQLSLLQALPGLPGASARCSVPQSLLSKRPHLIFTALIWAQAASAAGFPAP